MTRENFIAFVRGFRRPYASIVCATALAGAAVVGALTGNWMPASLAAVFASVVIGDGVARTVDKRGGGE